MQQDELLGGSGGMRDARRTGIVPSEDELAALPDDELLWMGVDLYNSGHFFEAHEVWEEVWLRAEREDRHFYQGLIQVTAAYVHLQRNEYPGLVKLLDEGVKKLQRYAPAHLGVSLTGVIAGAKASREAAAALGPSRLIDFDRGLIPRISAV